MKHETLHCINNDKITVLLELAEDRVQCSARSLGTWQHLAECQSSALMHVQAWIGGPRFPIQTLVSKLLFTSLHHHQLHLQWSCCLVLLSTEHGNAHLYQQYFWSKISHHLGFKASMLLCFKYKLTTFLLLNFEATGIGDVGVKCHPNNFWIKKCNTKKLGC